MTSNNNNKIHQHSSSSDETSPLLLLSSSCKKSKPRRKSSSNNNTHFRDSIKQIKRDMEDQTMNPNIYEAAALLRNVLLTDFASTTTKTTHTNTIRTLRKERIHIAWFLASGWWNGIVHASVIALMMLSFFEPPGWCSAENDDSHSSYPFNYTTTTTTTTTDEFSLTNINSINLRGRDGCEYFFQLKGSEDEYYYYPSSRSPLLSLKQVAMVEGFCCSVLSIYVCLNIYTDTFEVFWQRSKRKWVLIFTILSIINLLHMLMSHLYLLQFAHIRRIGLFLLFFNTRIEDDIAIVISILPDIFGVLFILFLIIILYAWSGVVLFYDSEEGIDHFPNIVEGMWSLWTAVTTANYPDVMMPAYNKKRSTTIYFASFMIISFYFLINVTLATVYNSYEENKKMNQESLDTKREEYLNEAFELLDRTGKGHISFDIVMAIFLVLNEDFPDIKYIESRKAELLFQAFDKDGDSVISKDEFMEFGDLLLYSFETADCYKTFVEVYFPQAYSSSLYKAMRAIILSPLFEKSVDGLIFANGIVSVLQSWSLLTGQVDSPDLSLSDGKIDTIWEVTQTIFTAIYCFEMFCKIFVFGVKGYFSELRNQFDGLITILTLTATVYVYYPNDYSNSTLIRLIIMARLLRLLRFLASLEIFQLTIGTLEVVIPETRNVVVLLYALMYIYASIGMYFFGGYITRDPKNPLFEKIKGTGFTENDYWANNFNDFFSGLNCMFNLVVVNNWPELADGLEAVTTKWSRWFFVTFHVLGVIVITNIAISVVIDAFVNLFQQKKSNTETRLTNQEEQSGSSGINLSQIFVEEGGQFLRKKT